MVGLNKSKKIELSELQDILYIMNFYHRLDGYMAHDLSGKLRFFDSEPFSGGAFITKKKLISSIKNYKQK